MALLNKLLTSAVNVLDRLLEIRQSLKYAATRKRYSIDPSFRFNGENILFYGEGEIKCGANSYIGTGSTIQADSFCQVQIGKSCMISHNVRMYTSSLFPDQDFSSPDLKEKKGDIVIGDYVWIGANVFINPGVTIGDNSVIGANSVVTKNVAENSIVGGVPAKLIRYKTQDVA